MRPQSRTSPAPGQSRGSGDVHIDPADSSEWSDSGDFEDVGTPSNEPLRDAEPPALRTALSELEAGRWPVVIHAYDAKVPSPGKAPIGNAWGQTKPTIDSLRATWKRYPKANVGLLLGAEGGVIDIDVDDPDQADEVLARVFPDGIPKTRGWTNAEGRYHLLFRWDDRLARYGKSIIKGVLDRNTGEVRGNPAYLGLEIRIGAASGESKQLQTVIPPSLMANGRGRRWNEHAEILPVPECLIADLDSHTVEERKAQTPKPESPKPAPVSARDVYVRKALDMELSRVATAPEGTRNEQLNRSAFAIGQLVGAGALDRAEAEQGLLQAALQAQLGEIESKKTIESGLNAGIADPRDLSGVGKKNGSYSRNPNGKAESNGHHPNGDGAIGNPPRVEAAEGEPRNRPEIRITTEEHDVNDQAIAALDSDMTLFRRGPLLVKVFRETRSRAKAAKVERFKGCPRIVELKKPTLREKLSLHASWKKRRRDDDGNWAWVGSHVPDFTVEAVAARGDYPGLRPLDGIVEAPTIRPDGSVLESPGWDESTGLLFEPNIDFPPIPTLLTIDDARRCVAELFELVADFPFAPLVDEGESHDGGASNRAAWLAALLTVLARGAIDGPCPMFLFKASTPATGKSKLCDLIAVLATGRGMARASYPEKDEEMSKLLLSIAIGADSTTLFDNLKTGTAIGGKSLDLVLTSETFKGRILGRSEMTSELPWRTVIFATGNNLGIKDDGLRRVVVSELKSPMENPEERRDFRIKGELLDYAKRERSRLVVAAVSILRAYVLAGRPDPGLTPMDYRAWSSLIRNAVFWAAGADPCAARKTLRQNDTETNERRDLIEGWSGLVGGCGKAGVKVSDALKQIKDNPSLHAGLKEVLLGWSSTEDLPSAKTIGKRLGVIRDRVIDDKAIVSVNAGKNTQAWKVVNLKGGGFDGFGGFTEDHAGKKADDRDEHHKENTPAAVVQSHQSHQSHRDLGGDIVEEVL